MEKINFELPKFREQEKPPILSNNLTQFIILGLATLIYAAFVIIPYITTFGTNLSGQTDNWIAFSGYITAFSSVWIGIVSAFLAVRVPMIIQYRGERAQQQMNVSTLATQFYSYDYYVQILCPVWDVTQKWQYLPSNDGGIRYRMEVYASQFISIDKTMKYCENPFRHPFNNKLGTQGHLHIFSTQMRHELVNEHMVFSMFHAFWRNIQQDLMSNNLSVIDVRPKFFDFYSYYRNIFQQLWMVNQYLFSSAEIRKTLTEQQGDSIEEVFSHPNKEERIAYFDFRYLDSIFFSTDDKPEYVVAFEQNNERAYAIAKELERPLIDWFSKGNTQPDAEQ